MKKFSFIVTALLMAIAFSAFTPVKKSSGKKSNPLFYFQVTSGVVGSQIGTGAIEREDAESETCPGPGNTDCARGYEDQENPGSVDNPAVDWIKRVE